MIQSVKRCQRDEKLNGLIKELEALMSADATTRRRRLEIIQKKLLSNCAALNKENGRASSRISLIRLFD